MPWVRLDDQFPDHPKIDQAGPLAGWLYVCGLAYCNRQLTDGFIPAATMLRLSTVPNPVKVAGALVAAGLWDEVDGGWQVHDFLEFQPSRAKVLAERQAASERQKRSRLSRRDKAVTNAVTSPELRRESHDPDPTRPLTLTSDLTLTPVQGPERDMPVDKSTGLALAAEAKSKVRGLRVADDTDTDAGGMGAGQVDGLTDAAGGAR